MHKASGQILLESLRHFEEGWRRRLARKGGRAPKTDALQILIQNCVQQELNIGQRELWHQLKKYMGLGIIRSIDHDEIEFLARWGFRTMVITDSGRS
jgi:hypothetical protein